MNKISMLLGSGVSIPAGLPSTKTITCEIMENWDAWYKFSDAKIYRQKKRSGQSKVFFNGLKPYPQKIVSLLKLIEIEIKCYYRSVANTDIEVNYEEIYDFLDQIYNALYRNIDNPTINRTICNLLCTFDPIDSRIPARDSLRDLCQEAMWYIKSVTYHMLKSNSSCIDYLDIIGKLIRNYEVKSIFTLNHDIVTESFLRKQQIEYYDGFSPDEENGVRFWNANLNSELEKLRFLKLHGSIDWWEFKNDNSGYSLKGIIVDWKSPDEKSIQIGSKLYYVDELPYFLTGTNSKFLGYNYGLYLDLFYEFHNLLRTETDTLIIAGYGFGDSAINLRIIDWFGSIQSDKYKNIEIITPDIDKTIQNAKGAMQSRLRDWKFDKYHNVNIIEKKIEDVNLSDFTLLD